jgi:hypothetical protein
MRDGFAYWFLMAMVRRLPMLLVAGAGVIVAVVRWKIHPKASLMTLIALLIYFMEVVLYNIFLYYLPNLIEPLRLSASGMRWTYSMVYFCEDIVASVIIILLVAAAFAGRRVTSDSIPATS